MGGAAPTSHDVVHVTTGDIDTTDPKKLIKKSEVTIEEPGDRDASDVILGLKLVRKDVAQEDVEQEVVEFLIGTRNMLPKNKNEDVSAVFTDVFRDSTWPDQFWSGFRVVEVLDASSDLDPDFETRFIAKSNPPH